ncbi:taste receptor type 2 member 8-like [Chanos chanos]|uniref:Taste receptor type 2 n=1 Tax=Chanos chanos TaxID=29144 RepID=A0A6J2WGL9_CHACN|nr:taste receptor type 2 member 8-like [Chanos chanos]
MSASSFATVRYLQHHMKSMKMRGNSFSSPRLRSQMRVTITGITQGLLYFATMLWILIRGLFIFYSSDQFDQNDYIVYTVITLYSFGTAVNLGVVLDDLLPPLKLHYSAYALMGFLAAVSMTSSVWLNVFYYSQIVPAHRSFFIWMKKNIKMVIFCALVINKIYFFFNVVTDSFAVSIIQNIQGMDINATDINLEASLRQLDALIVISRVKLWLDFIYIFLSLCVMSASSFATVRYLQHHMKSMKMRGNSFSSPRLRSQMRVTITGITQGLLYFATMLWILIRGLFIFYSSDQFDQNDYIVYTVITLYSFGTAVNLGVGQSLFRQRANAFWCKTVQAFQLLCP